MKTIFLTGMSGYVGSHLAARQLKKGKRVVGLVRENGLPGEAWNRAAAAIHSADQEAIVTNNNLVIVPGDLKQKCSILLSQVLECAPFHYDEVWHTVATFKNTESARSEIEEINIGGTEKMLFFVDKINLGQDRPRYFHVSTAYSQGKDVSVVPEAFVPGMTSFRTLYEWSKYCAEEKIWKNQLEKNTDTTIFRPTIIVGDGKTKAISNAGYYAFCEKLYSLCKKAEVNLGEKFTRDLELRYLGDLNIPINFVPVDFVIASMVAIAEKSELRGPSFKIFNLANEDAPLHSMVIKTLCEALRITGVIPVLEMAFKAEPMTSLERYFERTISFQAPYLRSNIGFSMDKFRSLVPYSEVPKVKTDSRFFKRITDQFLEALSNSLVQQKVPNNFLIAETITSNSKGRHHAVKGN